MELFRVFGSIFIRNDEADRALQETGNRAEGLGGKFGKMAKGIGVASAVVGGAAVAAGGALMGFAKNQAEVADNIDEGASKAGLSAKAYQEWAHVLKLSGSDISVLEKGMKTLSVAAEGATSGNKKTAASFTQLGVSVTDSYGKVKDNDTLLNEVTNSLAKMSPGAERTALAVSVLGKAAMELMPTLNSGVEGIADMKQEANDLGLVLDDTAIKTGVGLADALDKLQETMGSLAVKVITPLVPVVTQLADAFVAVIPGIIDLVKPLIAKLAPVLSDMIQKIMPVLLQLFDKFGPILMDVIGVVMQLTTSAIVPLLGVLLPLIASMANALIPAFMKILDVILPLLPPLLEIIQMIFPALMEVINVLITEALNILIEIFRQLSPVIAIVLDILKQLIQAGVLELIKAFLPLIASILPVLTELIQLLLPILTTFLTILLKVAQYVIPIVVESLTSLVRIISGSVSQCFKLLGDVIEGAANIGKEAFDGLLAWIRPVANSVIGFINGIIKGLNSISVTLPDWMPGVGGEHFGVNLPLIPALAKGGTASKAGWAIVGEQGPELIHLSRGAEVVPLASGQNQVIIDRGAFAGAFILDDYGVDKLLDRLVQRLKIYGVRP